MFCNVLKAMESKLDLNKYDSSSGVYEARMARVFEEVNGRIDRKLLEKDYARQQKNLHSGIQDFQTYAGSVSVVAVVMPAVKPLKGSNLSNGPEIATQVFISHIGDCRAVLCR